MKQGKPQYVCFVSIIIILIIYKYDNYDDDYDDDDDDDILHPSLHHAVDIDENSNGEEGRRATLNVKVRN
jgi:hypothetical protein